MARPLIQRDGVCPFIDLNDPRCDARFRLSHLDQAFHVCLSREHTRCLAYHQIAGAASGSFGNVPPTQGPIRDDRDYTIHLTVHGRDLPRADGRSELRPTGT